MKILLAIFCALIIGKYINITFESKYIVYYCIIIVLYKLLTQGVFCFCLETSNFIYFFHYFRD